jgi:hypothetical protein
MQATKKGTSNCFLIRFSLKQVEDKEKLKDFLRMLASATYENFKDMIDIPNNPIKSEEYLNAILEVSVIK